MADPRLPLPALQSACTSSSRSVRRPTRSPSTAGKSTTARRRAEHTRRTKSTPTRPSFSGTESHDVSLSCTRSPARHMTFISCATTEPIGLTLHHPDLRVRPPTHALPNFDNGSTLCGSNDAASLTHTTPRDPGPPVAPTTTAPRDSRRPTRAHTFYFLPQATLKNFILTTCTRSYPCTYIPMKHVPW